MKTLAVKKEALAKGLKTYYTGVPCKRGHLSARGTCDSGCLACHKERAVNWRQSTAGRKYLTKYGKAFRQSIAGRKYIRGYNKLPERKEYRLSARGKAVHAAANKKYFSSVKGWENKKRSLRKRYRVNPHHKLKCILRVRIRDALLNGYKCGSAVKLLGCTIQELKKHLERMFLPGMNWGNWAHAGWHLDHIKPLAKFDLTDPRQLARACHYKNLQPLWSKDNYKKGAR